MGSFRQNCEITEEKNENPPFSRHGHNKALEDDINKLFESVNARLARSLDLSGPRRNPSKKPMRESGSNSPVIGFSDPVSLKQALRGLCISQAAEMATLKRLSMPPSPRISEVEKFGNIYNVVETGEQKIETTFSDKNRLSSPRVVKLVTPRHNASPHIGVQPYMERLENNSRDSNGLQDECSASKYDVGISVVERQVAQCSSEEQPVCLQESSIVHEEVENKPVVDINVVEKGFEKNGRCEEHLVLRDSFSNHEKKIPDPNKPADVSNKEHDSSLQCRRRSKLSCGVKKVNKDGKNSGGSTIPAVKPVTINKNLVIKKLKKKGNPNARCRANNANKDTSRTLICHKCQCSLSNTVKDSHTTNGGEVVESNENPKLAEKRDISESSKSSVLDFSASTTTTATTSLSDDSCLSGPACVIRPHMSRDAKWGAINHVRKQNGFLGPTHFNLMRKLGSGDIGTVYLAELAGTGCLFAIKVMDNEFLARRKKLVRAQTEREILGILDHPFLPTLYAQFTSDNLSCLVMEFCPGGDLHVLRQKQPGQCFPEDAARFYVAEVLLALEYLHMLGIVYRDLKPENILVRGDGHIMLTDFDLSLHCPVTPALLPYSSPSPLDPPRPSGGPCAGSSCIDPFCSGPACQVSCFGPRALAKWQQKAEKCSVRQALPQLVAEPTGARSNSFVGTHEYLAPEIVRGEGHGSAVDWWTLGILLYELLYGRTPFRGPNDEGTLANVAVRELRFPEAPAVGFRARDLVRRLLVKGPEGRLGAGMGAAEIKGHPFFKGMNWALVRCGAPPWTPNDSSDGGASGDRSRFEMF